MTTPDPGDILDAAIREYLRATGNEGVVVDWVVLATQQFYDENGGGYTATNNIVPPNQPLYRSLGLIEYAAARVRAQVAGHCDLTDDEP